MREGSAISRRLREIARQTVAIIDAGGYRNSAGEWVRIDEAVRAGVTGTRHHLPDEPLSAGPPAGSGPAGTPLIEVTHESTLQAARRLGERAVALVFASAKNPGGGFLTGAQAQEESVARSSALYPCLLAASEFYEFHRAQRDLRYSDRVIYSPGVPVFRDDKGRLLDEPYRTAFLTSAAPNLGAIRRNQPEYVDDVPAVLRLRAGRILKVATAYGHRSIVLGAWGCGVFGNDPVTVASAFAEALRAVNRFDHVVFAIRDRLSGTPVLTAFTEAFAGWPSAAPDRPAD